MTEPNEPIEEAPEGGPESVAFEDPVSGQTMMAGLGEVGDEFVFVVFVTDDPDDAPVALPINPLISLLDGPCAWRHRPLVTEVPAS